MYVLGAEDILTVVKHITSVFNLEEKKEKAPFIKSKLSEMSCLFLEGVQSWFCNSIIGIAREALESSCRKSCMVTSLCCISLLLKARTSSQAAARLIISVKSRIIEFKKIF